VVRALEAGYCGGRMHRRDHYGHETVSRRPDGSDRRGAPAI
jgi:hypothetical protein